MMTTKPVRLMSVTMETQEEDVSHTWGRTIRKDFLLMFDAALCCMLCK